MKKSKENSMIKAFLIIFTCLAVVLSIVLLANINKTEKLKLSAEDAEIAVARQYGQVEESDEMVDNTENVRFSAFFLRDLDQDGYAEKVKGTCKAVGSEDTLYFTINVLTEGYLKNGKIELEKENFYFKTAIVADEIIKDNYVSDNTQKIELNQIDVGTQKMIFGNVRSGVYGNYRNAEAIGNDTTKYSKINKVKFTGIYVDENGVETNIEKIIDLPIDWYETPETEIPNQYAGNKYNLNQNHNLEKMINRDKGIVDLKFSVAIQEIDNLQILEGFHVEGEIPELNGYKPLEVKVSSNGISGTFDSETGKYSLDKHAITNEEGLLLEQIYDGAYKNQRYNIIDFSITYDIEAYNSLGSSTIALNLPIRASYFAYNNPNEEFNNPIESNIAEAVSTNIFEIGGGDTVGFDVKVGTYVAAPYDAWVVSKAKVSNAYVSGNVDENDTYIVYWRCARGADSTLEGLSLREPDDYRFDRFLTRGNQYISMENIVSFKGIYFSNPSSMLKNDGYINVYNDDTDELIHTFTKEDWSKYSYDNPYLYDSNVKHIRVETSYAKNNSSFDIYHVKEIDINALTSSLSKEEFDNIQLIYSYLEGSGKRENSTEFTVIKNDTDRASYDEIVSIANITNITPSYFSTQETKENALITIATQSAAYNTAGWVDGEFLVKVPEEILDMEINDITINNPNVEISGYSLEKRDDGCYYISIYTENKNKEEYDFYNIVIDCNITPNPTVLSSTKAFCLYARNNINTTYKSTKTDDYDIDNDENFEEIVGYATRNTQFIGPATLVTMEKATEYNNNHDELDTTYGPQVAIIDKETDEKTARVVVNILDNYSGKISDVKIIGKIPFEGNKYQILSDKNMGSMYTTKMIEGIQIPENLKDYVKVYYSLNEVVNKNLNDESNNWIAAENVQDLTNVKNYYIDLGDYVLTNKESIDFSYKIELPDGLNFNDVSYATHAAYFSLETIEGKLADKVETNKLGFMIAKKYNLKINKVKEFTDINLQGGRFQLIDDEGKRSIKTSNVMGELEFKNLFVDRVYELREIKAPDSYNLSDNNIKFRTSVNERGELEYTIIEGNVRSQQVDGNNVLVVVENTPKFDLDIIKYEKGTNNVLSNVSYEIRRSSQEKGSVLTTDENGKISLKNLIIGEEYTIKEVKAKGYYIDRLETRFKVVKTNEKDYELEVVQGNLKDTAIVSNVENNNKPVISLEYEDEKVPTYDLTITKYEKESDIVLKGATYKLFGPGFEDGETFITGEDGKVTIEGLYRFVEGKEFDGIYTLKEIVPPEGYKINSEDIVFKAYVTEGEPHIDLISGQVKMKTDGNTEKPDVSTILDEQFKVSIGLEDEPLFKLIKRDGETGVVIPNTKFIISEVLDKSGSEGPALDPKGEKVGTVEEYRDENVQVITTDEKGEISLGLRSGVYKLVEIEAAEGYQLPEREEDRTYFFGIDKSSEEVREIIIRKNETIIGKKEVDIYDTAILKDGSIVDVGCFYSAENFIIPGEQTVSGEELIIPIPFEKAIEDEPVGIMIKRNSEGKVEDVKIYASAPRGYDCFNGIDACEDGDFIVFGEGKGDTIIPAEQMDNGEEYTIDVEDNNDYTFIFRYNTELKIKNIFIIEGENDPWFFTPGIECPNGDIVGVLGGSKFKISSESTVDGKEYAYENYSNCLVVLRNDGLVKKCLNLYRVQDEDNKVLYKDGYLYVILDSLTSNNTIDADSTTFGSQISLKKYNSYILKINSEYLIESYLEINNSYCIKNIKLLEDDGIIITGSKDNVNKSISFGGNILNENPGEINTTNSNKGYILKINEDSNFEWINNIPSISNSNYYEYYETTEDNDENIVLYGTFYNNNYLTNPYNINYPELNTEDGISKTYTLNNRYNNIKIIFSKDGKLKKLQALDYLEGYKLKQIIFKENYLLSNYIKDTSKEVDTIVFDEEWTKDGQKIILNIDNTDYNRVSIKSDYNDKIESAYVFDGYSYNRFNQIFNKEDGYTVFGYTYNNKIIIDSSKTENGQEIVIENTYNKGVRVDFNDDDKVKSIKVFPYRIMDVKQNKDGSVFVKAICTQGTSYSIPPEETVSGNEIILSDGSDAYYKLIKYNSNEKVEFVYDLTSSDVLDNSYDESGIVVLSSSGREIVFPAEMTLNGEEATYNNSNYKGFHYYINKDGKVEWCESNYFNRTSDYIPSNNGYYIVGYSYNNVTIPAEKTVLGEEIQLNIRSSRNAVIKYNDERKVEWAVDIPTDNYNYTNKGILLENENLVIFISKKPESECIIPSEATESNVGDIVLGASESKEEGFIVINKEGKIVDVELLGDYCQEIFKTQDGGFLIAGLSSVDIDANQTVSEKAIKQERHYEQYVVKVNKDYKVENVYYLNMPHDIYNFFEENGKYYFAGSSYGINTSILTIEDNLILPEIAPGVDLSIENTKIKYNIICNVIKHEELDELENVIQVEGGTISGNGSSMSNPYEVVNYGEDSKNEIKIVPDAGYKILNIRINDKDIDFTSLEKEDGSVTLEQFTNMHENKNISVVFSKDVTSLKVHYYLENTGEEYGTEPIRIKDDKVEKGRIGDYYSTSPEMEIGEYELIKDNDGNYIIPSNASGTYTENEINIYYYYREKEVPLIVNYYIFGTETPVPLKDGGEAESENDKGKKGNEYVTTALSDEEINSKYELVEVPANATGIYGEEAVIVNYYYKLKDSSVTIKYIDIDTNEEIDSQEVKYGKVDDPYTSEQRTIDGYTYVDVEGEQEGVMQSVPTEVVYYYKKNAKVIIRYVDINTNKELDDRICVGSDYDVNDIEFKNSTVVIEGKVGDGFETVMKAFVDYKLVEKPDSIPEKMTREDIVLVYKYDHLSEGEVIERHIDTITKELLEPEISHTGKEGNPYKIDSKEFEGYDLVEEKIPNNSEGTYTNESITVTYEYIKKSNVTVKYIDKDNNEEILPEEIINGHEKDPYETEQKSKDGYIFIEDTGNTKGEMSSDTIEVKYYYKKQAEVIVEYKDLLTGKNIIENDEIDGYIGKEYDVSSKEIDGYKLVEEKLPSNNKGEMTEEPITVTYFYLKETKVIEEHIYKDTILHEETHEGFEGDEYSTEPLKFDDYILDEDRLPNNNKGYMGEDVITVKYYYTEKAVVIEKHIDQETKEILAYEKHEGKVGDRYNIPARNFPGYDKIYATTDNNRGEMTKEQIEVIFYYAKTKKETPAKQEPKVQEPQPQQVPATTQNPVTIVVQDGNGKTTSTVTAKSGDTVVVKKDTSSVVPKVDPDYEIVKNVPDTDSETNKIFHFIANVIELIGISIIVLVKIIDGRKRKK